MIVLSFTGFTHAQETKWNELNGALLPADLEEQTEGIKVRHGVEEATPLKLTRRLGIGRINSVDWSPDGHLIAVGASVGIYILDAQTLGVLKSLEGHTNWVTSVVFSPNGKLLASGSRDGTIKLWRVSDGENIKTLREYTGVNSVTFSPDGRLLVSGSMDGTIGLWSIGPPKEENYPQR